MAANSLKEIAGEERAQVSRMKDKKNQLTTELRVQQHCQSTNQRL